MEKRLIFSSVRRQYRNRTQNSRHNIRLINILTGNVLLYRFPFFLNYKIFCESNKKSIFCCCCCRCRCSDENRSFYPDCREFCVAVNKKALVHILSESNKILNWFALCYKVSGLAVLLNTL